jgi:hypothetical protein
MRKFNYQMTYGKSKGAVSTMTAPSEKAVAENLFGGRSFTTYPDRQPLRFMANNNIHLEVWEA